MVKLQYSLSKVKNSWYFDAALWNYPSESTKCTLLPLQDMGQMKAYNALRFTSFIYTYLTFHLQHPLPYPLLLINSGYIAGSELELAQR